jgi:tetratricopeptide (TPR) repeat protein
MTHPSISTAEALLNASNPAGALQELKKVFADDPDSVDGGVLAARAYVAQRKYAEAETAARQVLKQDAENMRALSALAGSHSWRAQYKQGMPVAEQMIRIDPDDPMGFLHRAIFYEQWGKYKEAEASYLEAMERDPGGLTNARALYGDFLMNRGRLDDAAKITEELTSEDAGNVEAAILRGHVALREGRTSDAREDALWALSQEAENWHALGLLASIKMKTSPIMGLWWRYTVWMGKFTRAQRIAIVIGLLFAVRLVRAVAGPFAPVILTIWVLFCITTWIGPAIMRRMVERELKSVKIKDF